MNTYKQVSHKWRTFFIIISSFNVIAILFSHLYLLMTDIFLYFNCKQINLHLKPFKAIGFSMYNCMYNVRWQSWDVASVHTFKKHICIFMFFKLFAVALLFKCILRLVTNKVIRIYSLLAYKTLHLFSMLILVISCSDTIDQ